MFIIIKTIWLGTGSGLTDDMITYDLVLGDGKGNYRDTSRCLCYLVKRFESNEYMFQDIRKSRAVFNAYGRPTKTEKIFSHALLKDAILYLQNMLVLINV